MNTNTAMNSQPNQNLAPAIRRRMIQVFSYFGLLAAILFISSGRINWLWAWVYIGAGIVILAINATVMSPELIAERGKKKEDAKYWDTIITRLTILPMLAVFVVAGLDIRFGWTAPPPLMTHMVGLILVLAGNLLVTWAMVSNHYFSTVVRLQFDRGHSVATGGPYRFVRHPGYVGFIVSNIGTPLLFGSVWTLIPAVVASLLFVIRTALEDRTLQEELPGYHDFANRIRYRLLPGIW